jgi:hypothetical protein
MKNFAVLFFLPFLVSGAVLPSGRSTESLAFESCGNGIPTPVAVRVPDCKEVPCTMVIGGVGISEVDFEASFETNTVTPEVRGKALGITVKYKLPEEVVKDGCKHTITSGECPLKQGELYNFKLGLPVESPLANINVAMEFKLLGDDKKVLFCYKMQMRVVR